MRNTVQYLSAQAGRILNLETYTLVLITLGIPAVFYIYVDWRAAFASFVVTQVLIGVLSLRSAD